MKRFVFVTMVAAMALWTIPAAAQWTQLVNEDDVKALTDTVTDPQVEDIAVDATGRIYVVDEAPANNETILRFNADGTGGVKITDETAIKAAVELVNNAATQSAVTINGISVAQDGDIIVTGDGGSPENAVMVSINPTTFAITVLCCAVDTTPASIEGCQASTVLNNVAYVCINGAFGPTGAEDCVVTVDTNATGPNAPASIVLNQTTLEGLLTGETAGAAQLGPICAVPSLMANGGNVFVADSSGNGTTDDIIRIAVPPAGPPTITLLLDKDDTLADLNVLSTGNTDVGYNGLVANSLGKLWGSNQFGNTGAGADNGIVKFTNIAGAAADTFLWTETTIRAQIGEGDGANFFFPCRGAYQSTTGKVLFATQGLGTKEGVIAIGETAAVADWSMY